MLLARSKHFNHIETIRALAALSVGLFHFFNGVYQKGPIIKNEKIRDFFAYGAQGVEIFYILSGFIITYSLIKKGYVMRDFFKFCLKRLLRIFPPYFFTVLCIICLDALFARFIWYNPYTPNWQQIWINLLFLADYFPQQSWINPIFKTLKIEFQYYFLLGLVVPFIKLSFGRFLIFTLILLGLTAFTINYDSMLISAPYFLVGIASYFIFDKGLNLKIGIVIIILFAFLIQFYMWQDFFVSVLSMFLILLLPTKTKALNMSGRISYSFYLIHGLVGGQFLYHTSRYGFAQNHPLVMILFALLISWIAAACMYRLIERPVMLISSKIKYSAAKKST